MTAIPSLMSFLLLASRSVTCFQLPTKLSTAHSAFHSAFHSAAHSALVREHAALVRFSSTSSEPIPHSSPSFPSISVSTSPSIIPHIPPSLPTKLLPLLHNMYTLPPLSLPPQFSLDVWLCTDEEMRDHNRDYRGVDGTTDVLSFPSTFSHYAEPPPPPPPPQSSKDARQMYHESLMLGDILISVPYVLRSLEAPPSPDLEGGDCGCAYHISKTRILEERIALLAVHGVVHLRGYDHEIGEDDWGVQCAVEDEIISNIDIKAVSQLSKVERTNDDNA